MADTTDLFKAMNTSALIDAAKYGGYGGIDLNSLSASRGSKLGGLADILLPALHAALPQSPLFSLANAARQAFNVNQYNKQAQQQALYALQQERVKNSNDASIFNKRTGMNISGPFDATLANSAAPDIRNDNAIPSLNDLLSGKALTLANNANYDPALIRDYAGRMGDVANFQNQSKGLGAIADGQNQSLIHNTLINNSGGPIGGLQQGQMHTSQPGMLSTGVSKSGAPQYIQDGISPYLMPTDIPAQIAGNQRAGLNDAQAAGTLRETIRHNTLTTTETARHNRADEGIGRTNAQAHMISANKAGSAGRAPNIMDFMTPEQRAQYAARTAAGNPSSQQDPYAGQLYQQAQIAKGAYGEKSPEAKAAAQQYSDYISQNSPGNRAAVSQLNLGSAAAGLLSNPMSQFTSPFGNTAKGNLKNVGKNVGAQYGVQY